jgi:hypothetical protein
VVLEPTIIKILVVRLQAGLSLELAVEMAALVLVLEPLAAEVRAVTLGLEVMET